MDSEASLLFQLRLSSLKTEEKLALAERVDVASSVVRDWTSDLLLRSKKESKIIVNSRPWRLLRRHLDAASSSNATSSLLPAFTSFATLYSDSRGAVEEGVCSDVESVFTAIGASLMRRANVDVALECHKAFLDTSATLLEEKGGPRPDWIALAANVEQAFVAVAEAGRGSKKLPQHILENLSNALTIARHDEHAQLSAAARQTIECALYSSDNIRRQLAQQSYAGAGSTVDKNVLDHDTFETLKGVDSPFLGSHLALLFTMFETSLRANGLALFPLPTRNTYKNASSARSAAEVHELENRRQLAAQWVDSAIDLLKTRSSEEALFSCAKDCFDIVKDQDLFHVSQKQLWHRPINTLLDACRTIFSSNSPLSEKSDLSRALLLLTSIARVSFDAVTPVTADALQAITAMPVSHADDALPFLQVICEYHTRTLTLSTLLAQLQDALAVAPTRRNAIIASSALRHFAKVISAMPATTINDIIQDLSSTIRSAAAGDEDGEPKKKRRKTEGSVRLSAARRVLTMVSEHATTWSEEALATAGQAIDREGLDNDSLRLYLRLFDRTLRTGESKPEALPTKKLHKLLAGKDIESAVLAAQVALSTSEDSLDEASSFWPDLLRIIQDAKASKSVRSAGPDYEYLEDAPADTLSFHLWALVTARFVPLLERSGGEKDLATFSSILTNAISKPTALSEPSRRLLDQAEFYELPRLQATFRKELQSGLEGQSKKSKAPYASLPCPAKYLGRPVVRALVEKALSVALDAKASEAARLSSLDLLNTQFGGQAAVHISPDQARRLLDIDGDVPVTLWSSCFRAVVEKFKADGQADLLLSWLASLSKPFSSLARQAKQGVFTLTNEDRAQCQLLFVLASSGMSRSSLPDELISVIDERVNDAASKISKALKLVDQIEQVESAEPELLKAIRAVLSAAQSLQIPLEKAHALERFVQQSLSAHFGSATSSATIGTCLALLEGRVSPAQSDTTPFEAVVLLRIRANYLSRPDAPSSTDHVWRTRITGATPEQYARGQQLAFEALQRSGEGLWDEAAVFTAISDMLQHAPPNTSRVSQHVMTHALNHVTAGLSTQEIDVVLARAIFVERTVSEKTLLISRSLASSILAFVCASLSPSRQEQMQCQARKSTEAKELFARLVTTVEVLVRHQKEHVTAVFATLIRAIELILSALRRTQSSTKAAGAFSSRRHEREASATFPAWLWHAGGQAISRDEVKLVTRLLSALTARTTSFKRKHDGTSASDRTSNLVAPLSKHAPFLVLSYVRSCTHPTMPIPSSFRSELQESWHEVFGAMGKWERESIMQNVEDDVERDVLRQMIRRLQ